MEFTDEPATWKQLKYLRQLGYQPDHRLSKSEATSLIYSLGGQTGGEAGLAPNRTEETTARGPSHLHARVENAQSAVAKAQQAEAERCRHELIKVVAERQEFWIDTCREAARMHSHAMPVLELYRKYGCLYNEPTHGQAQDILDALDSALPNWDRDHPELFYQTLGLNFPELLRRR